MSSDYTYVALHAHSITVGTVKLDGFIVSNEHNTVFASQRSVDRYM